MKVKTFKLLIALWLVVPVLSACTVKSPVSISTSSSKNFSMFVTTDKGDNWQSAVNMPTVGGKIQTLPNFDVKKITLDPQDSLAVYLASIGNGLYYTYNAARGWNQVPGLPKETVNDVQVDPKNKCLIYVAILNRLYSSSDCARTWKEIYVDNNQGVQVTAITIDHYNPHNLYIGTSRGDIIKSIDAGAYWRTIKRLDKGIAYLAMSPSDSRLLYLATVENKIFSFTSNVNTNADNSADIEKNFAVDNWTDLNLVLKDFKLSNNFKDLIVSPSDDKIFLATDKMILRSADKGITWENIKLIQPEKDAVINALAVNPKNSQEIYYVTNTTFFRSEDGGVSWKTKDLSTERAGRDLVIDFNNPSVLYLGTFEIKK